jgi:hypothetical protein
MGRIASTAEFAYALRLTEAQAEAHLLLLELAEGLVIEELGELDVYPVRAKAVVLAAAARAFTNPAGLRQESVGSVSRSYGSAELGVYLTDAEVAKLHGRTARQPSFSFPDTWPYPDPVERPTRPVSWP